MIHYHTWQLFMGKFNVSEKKIAATELSSKDKQRLAQLEDRVSKHIYVARQAVQRTVDSEMVKAYWKIGRDIVEEEQQGQQRARYGSFLLKSLSTRLTAEHGRGFSLTTLKEARTFYLEYQVDSETSKGRALRDLLPALSENLGWIHYRALMRIKRKEARQFYEKETIENQWSGRELERQVASLLFDRLAMSKDKDGIQKLSQQGQEVNNPEDALKEPLILEFLGLPESHRLVESKVEQALIDNLQKFLLELGKGFSFIARQKRLTLDGDHFYADLVFYHVILKCYIIIDIKTRAVKHADLGQMQLYVNYFDMEIKQDNDNPTLGLVLCTKNKKNMAKYLLGDKSKQVFSTRYQLHLPTEEELEQELQRELKTIEHQLSDEKL